MKREVMIRRLSQALSPRRRIVIELLITGLYRIPFIVIVIVIAIVVVIVAILQAFYSGSMIVTELFIISPYILKADVLDVRSPQTIQIFRRKIV